MTELGREPELDVHLESIMRAAARDLQQSCKCDGFVFVMCKGTKKRDHNPKEAVVTPACCEILSQEHGLERTKPVKKGPCCPGTFCVSYDKDRRFELLSVYPNRQKGGAARHNAKDSSGLCWVAVDCFGDQSEQTLPMNGKSPQESARRAAAIVRPILFSFIPDFL